MQQNRHFCKVYSPLIKCQSLNLKKQLQVLFLLDKGSRNSNCPHLLTSFEHKKKILILPPHSIALVHVYLGHVSDLLHLPFTFGLRQSHSIWENVRVLIVFVNFLQCAYTWKCSFLQYDSSKSTNKLPLMRNLMYAKKQVYFWC